jgi:predicted branched-subunit amino acid permease
VALPCKWGSGLNKTVVKAPPLWHHSEFTQGLRDTASIAPGIAAWGLMTGVAMMKSGLSLVESLSMALLVFAGSSQLASMPLIVAGAPMWVVLATGFCVNLRFVVFSIHLRPYMMHQPLWRRLASGYFTTDLSYVLFVKRYEHPAPPGDVALIRAQEAYLAGNCFLSWCSWVFACTVSAIVAGAAAVAAYALPLKLNIVVAICVAVVVCLSLEKLRPATSTTSEGSRT